ncbi:AAA family ATPase [Mycolicibacterium austroafricanum]|uniref:AAA family ATPase n=1 Tax=Mycolicibacterium austroafricanum TaxID=39687 RepID=A0ABT8HBI9_MYCAO|nr:AAA family ATPase [Mycolicibacterium austroafricanum]MDN4518143.1 AAA family ATPase [Mycolicibacterium austroafricanum]
MTAHVDPYADVPPPDEEPGVTRYPHKGAVTGNTLELRVLDAVPTALPVRNPDCGYADISALLDGGIPEPPTPHVCLRSDGIGLFYSGQYNVVFGDPESGKTLLCDYATVQVLNNGGRVLRLDMDHNGVDSTVSRLLGFGADENALRDPDQFLYVEPVDRAQIIAVIDDMADWKPTLVIIDSVGELLPLFGAGSNSADEFTAVHSRVIKPLTRTGACVVGIDHLAKGADSRAFGPTGTAAKKRAIGGTSIRVKVDSAFTPDKGGSAYLSIHKDRHGGLRRHSPSGDREPLCGKFVILGDHVRVQAPMPDDHNPDEQPDPEDVAAIAALDPPPTSVRDARERIGWRMDRTAKAFKAFKQGGSRNEP